MVSRHALHTLPSLSLRFSEFEGMFQRADPFPAS
jgi:hypothetical protein